MRHRFGLLYSLILVLLLFSCSITKRHYRSGFFIERHSEGKVSHTQKIKNHAPEFSAPTAQCVNNKITTTTPSLFVFDTLSSPSGQSIPLKKRKLTAETSRQPTTNLNMRKIAALNLRATTASRKRHEDESKPFAEFFFIFLLVLICLIIPPVLAIIFINDWDFINTAFIILITIIWLGLWLFFLFTIPPINSALIAGGVWNLIFLVITIIENAKN